MSLTTPTTQPPGTSGGAERLTDGNDVRPGSKRMSEPHPMMGMGCCYNCGRPYGDEHGFPDLIIPLETWRKISPTGDEGGLLCPSCICKELSRLRIRECPAAFMSGPIRSVSPELMNTMRWVENIRLKLWPEPVPDRRRPAAPAPEAEG